MGNYGNTLDRWYRRAAVVVWPRERAFAARAEAGSQWALHQLRDRIEAGDLDGARAAAESLAPFWKKIGAQPGLLGAALEVAAGLDAAGTAAMLLEPFRIETVAQEHAGGLAAAAGRYGEEWTRSVVDGWFGPGHPYGTELYEWVDNRLPGLCEALRAAGERTVARLLAAGAWRRMDASSDSGPAFARTEIRRPAAGDAELAAGAAAGGGRRRAARRDHGERCARTGTTSLECLMPALRLAEARRAAGLDAVARDCAERLGAIIARPPRTKTTGRSNGPGAGAACVTRSGRSSAPGRDGSSNGRWRQTGAGTCTPGSTRPGCRCGTRPGGRGGRTPWC